MHLLYAIYFLALVLGNCYANEQGIVTGFFPDGNYNFALTYHENDGDPLVDVWLKEGDEFVIHLLCHKYEINAKSSRVISQLRAIILTKDNAELENFKVKSCDESVLRAAMQIKKTSEQDNKKGYEIVFKDDKNGCRKRTYMVNIIKNDVEPFFGITRSAVETLPNDWRRRCPVSGEGVALDWYEDGEIHDLPLTKEYVTVLPLQCENVFVLCRKAGEGEYFADIVAGKAPIDRIKVSTCDVTSMKISIKLDLAFTTETRYRGVFINYLTTDGRCLVRKYKYDVLYETDPMLGRAFIEREAVQELLGCKSMKAQGYGRYLFIKVRSHFGGLSGKMVSFRKTTDND